MIELHSLGYSPLLLTLRELISMEETSSDNDMDEKNPFRIKRASTFFPIEGSKVQVPRFKFCLPKGLIKLGGKYQRILFGESRYSELVRLSGLVPRSISQTKDDINPLKVTFIELYLPHISIKNVEFREIKSACSYIEESKLFISMWEILISKSHRDIKKIKSKIIDLY